MPPCQASEMWWLASQTFAVVDTDLVDGVLRPDWERERFGAATVSPQPASDHRARTGR
jgi:hypothetical protein